jgi:hypothetical protein
VVYGFINNLSPLKKIVSSQAILSTIANRANIELINESIIIQEITNFNRHPLINTITIGMVIGTYIIYYKTSFIEQRWRNIEIYSNQRRLVNIVLLVFLIIFVRNVESAM